MCAYRENSLLSKKVFSLPTQMTLVYTVENREKYLAAHGVRKSSYPLELFISHLTNMILGNLLAGRESEARARGEISRSQESKVN